MSLVFIAPDRKINPYKDAVLKVDSQVDVEIWPDVKNNKRVQFVVAWHQPQQALRHFPNLKAISTLGAGVDFILQDDTIPKQIPVCRIVSKSLTQQMKEYIFNAILNYQRNTYTYFSQRLQKNWEKHPDKSRTDIPIGIMGLGVLGKPIAHALAQFGYKVSGWANSPKEIEAVQVFTGKGDLGSFLSRSKVLVCLLPLTAKTKGILDLNIFKEMRHPGYLINVARGGHLVEEDLIYALDKNWLDGACLDVFNQEPLPHHHPFWNRSNIIITPHVASISHPSEVAAQIVDNYKRAISGLELRHKVDKKRGY